jgi:hypothetical protein
MELWLFGNMQFSSDQWPPHSSHNPQMAVNCKHKQILSAPANPTKRDWIAVLHKIEHHIIENHITLIKLVKPDTSGRQHEI